MEKLIEIKRGRITEREHFGYLILTNNEKLLYKNFNDIDRHFYLRSCAKPMQTSVLQDLGVFEKFGFRSEEVAVISSSHSATKKHVEVIRSILKKTGLNESVLKCGVHPPLDKKHRHYLIKNNLPSLDIHNNCSGKHAGFLASCVKQGWDINTYLKFDHPLQKLIKNRINDFCNYESPFLSEDGCSAPITAMPLPNMCYGFAKCFIEYPRIQKAFSQNPELIGGPGRIDTEVIRATNGRLIAKVGAEGLCMVFNTETQQVFAVKILDSNMQARSIVLINSLKQLDWLSQEELTNNPLNQLNETVVKTQSGDIAGEIKLSFKISV